MYKTAGLGVVVIFGIICILKMLALGHRVNRNVPQNHTPSASPSPFAKLPPDPNANLSDPVTATDPVNVAPKHDPANDAPKRDPSSVAPKRDPAGVAPKTDAEAGRGFDPNFIHTAALQAWFGQEKELAATCDRTLRFLKDTNNPAFAERAAKICSLRQMDDQTHEAALVLARRAVELGRGNRALLPYLQMALGMAEYRSGNYAEADAALLEAAKLGKDNYYVSHTSAFYRALSLFRLGKEAEPQKLAAEAIAKMKPLPADERNPLVGTNNADDLILWMAYKEAKELLKLTR
jgi:hypothetical protein